MEEGTLSNENICDIQSKTGASEEKNKVTDNSYFDVADVITGRKIVNVSWPVKKNITILQNIIGLKTKVHYSKKMYQRRRN